MTRGDVVLVALRGDYGKPRPAVVIQADAFREHASVVVLPCTSHLHQWPGVRVLVQPDHGNGLRAASEVMVDIPHSYDRDRVERRIGRLAPGDMLAIERALATFLGLG